MFKSTILAALALVTLSTESQARPQIWNFLGGVAVGAALANTYDYGYSSRPVYYTEPRRVYQSDPYVTYYASSRYYYREPEVVYYGRPVRRCR